MSDSSPSEQAAPSAHWRQKISARIAQLCASAWAAPAEQVRVALFWSFWAAIVIFPFGPSVREIMPSLCLLLLARYYYLDWHNSTLRLLPVKFLFVMLLLGIASGVILSQNVWDSFLHVIRHVNKGYVYPLVAMECVRSTKELQRIIWAFVIAAFWQGLDGIWQHYTGYDFIDNTPIMGGRLTGSLTTYRVGNYIALTLMPAIAIYLVLRNKYSQISAGLASAVLLFPPFFLLYFSYTRSGYLAFAGGLCLLLCLRVKTINWKLVLAVPAAGLIGLASLMILIPHRFSFSVVAGDGRWDLWRFAWAVFEQNPWFGAGFGQYNSAFRALGYVPTLDEITISHPHNIYLQFLCESGMVGAVFLTTFLLGFLYWGFRQVRQGLAIPHNARKNGARYYWQLTSFFWAAWGAFMVNGIFGHDFYRLWWFSLATMLLGVMVGACVHGPRTEAESELTSNTNM